jgi:uncharacterized membrane protein YdjX (TVP38/TMEM64 family)
LFFISQYFLEKRLNAFQKKLDEESKSVKDLFLLLVSMRLFPFTPNWLLNIASGVVGVPLHLFAGSVGLGLLPYNTLMVSAGAWLAELKSLSDAYSPKSIAILLLLSVLAALPTVLKRFGVLSVNAKKE